MTGINSAVTGKFSDPPVIMTGFISRPDCYHSYCILYLLCTTFLSSIQDSSDKEGNKTPSLIEESKLHTLCDMVEDLT